MNPIERLIAAGCNEILHESGWAYDYTRSEWYCYILGPGKFAEKPSEALSIHIQLAGNAAQEWLCRQGLRVPVCYWEDKYQVEACGCHRASTAAEALIDAAIAVWEASRV